MQWHEGPPNFPERGDRIKRIREHICDQGLAARCRILRPAEATRAELSLCHEERYLDSLRAGETEFVQRDMYGSDHAQMAAQLACGCAIAAAVAVAPPGGDDVTVGEVVMTYVHC